MDFMSMRSLLSVSVSVMAGAGFLMAEAPNSTALAAKVERAQKTKKKHPVRLTAAPQRRDLRPVSAIPPEATKPAPVSPYGWLVTVNAKALVSPRWIGASRYGFIAYPTLSFRRPGEPAEWSSPDDSISFAAFTSGGFNVGPSIAFRGGRYDASSPACSPAFGSCRIRCAPASTWVVDFARKTVLSQVSEQTG
jgi:hypothetical protein